MTRLTTVKIASLGKVVTGSTPPAAHPDWFAASGVPFVTPSDLIDGQRQVRTQRFLSEVGAQAMAKRLVPEDAVCFVSIGSTIGKMCSTTSPSVTNQQINSLVVDESVADPTYIYYAISQRSEHLKAIAGGSATPILNKTSFASVELDVLPLSEQRTIGAMLGALDDKIESNRRTVETLERLGAAILEEVLKLDVYGFPDYRSDLRMGDVVSLLETGSRPKGGVSTEGQGVVSLGAESIQSAGFTSTTRFKKVPREFIEGMRRGRLTDGDVLVYKDGGSPGNFVPHVSAFGYGFPVEEAAINEHVYRARGSDEVSQGLLYWLLRSPWMDGEMRKRGTGVAIPGLNSTNFRDLPWPVMAPQIQRGLNDALNPMLVLMLRLGAENRRIASLRDVLLPELLSGRIHPPIVGEE